MKHLNVEQRRARVAQVLDLRAKGKGEGSIAVIVGCDRADVEAILREADGNTTEIAIAKRCGLTLAAYREGRAQGLRYCRPHNGGAGGWVTEQERSQARGASDICKACHRALDLGAYEKPRGRPAVKRRAG